MKNDISNFIGLFITGLWVVIFLFSIFRKNEYLSIIQKILLFIICSSYFILNTVLADSFDVDLSWYFVMFYISQVSCILFLAHSFKLREIKTDELNNIKK